MSNLGIFILTSSIILFLFKPMPSLYHFNYPPTLEDILAFSLAMCLWILIFHLSFNVVLRLIKILDKVKSI